MNGDNKLNSSSYRKHGKMAFQNDLDPRELPEYGIPEVAHYLDMPASTLRSWVLGRYYQTEAGKEFSSPIISLPDREHPFLSFINFVEAHVLSAIRRDHKVTFEKVRTAVNYLETHLKSKHPLSERAFETDGLDLFIHEYGQLINVTQPGQLAMRDVLESYLRRIERDPKGLPIRLYPFTRNPKSKEQKLIVVDPFVSFGRPVLAGTRIPSAIIAERYMAGETTDELAKDYDRERREIEEIVRCEVELRAA